MTVLAPKLNKSRLLDRFGTMYRITRRHVLTAGATVLIAAGGIVGGSALRHNPPVVPPTTTTVPAGLANAWVNPALTGSCVWHTTAASYVSSESCHSFNAAKNVSPGGGLVLAMPGTAAQYDQQILTNVNKGTSIITFRPATPGTVTLVKIEDHQSYVTFDGFDFIRSTSTTRLNGGAIEIDAASVSPSDWVSHVTVSNFTGPPQKIDIQGSYLTLLNGEQGYLHACRNFTDGGQQGLGIWEDGLQINRQDQTDGSSRPSDHVVIDNVNVHDNDHWNDPANPGLTSSGGSGTCPPHTDGLQMAGGLYITIKNSSLYRNATSNILASDVSLTPMDHILIQNVTTGDNLQSGGNDITFFSAGDLNVFNPCWGSTNDITVEYSTLASGIVDACSLSQPRAISRGNIYGNSVEQCTGPYKNINYFYDVFAGTDGSCGGFVGTKICTPTYVDPNHGQTGNGDIASSDTCAKGAGDPSNFPPTDRHGVTRTSPPDAGADKVG